MLADNHGALNFLSIEAGALSEYRNSAIEISLLTSELIKLN